MSDKSYVVVEKVPCPNCGRFGGLLSSGAPTSDNTKHPCPDCGGRGFVLDVGNLIEVEPGKPLHVTQWVNNEKRGTRTDVGPTLQTWTEVVPLPVPSTDSKET